MKGCAVALGWLLVASQVMGDDGLRIGPDDWPWWRGPNRNAVARVQKVPTTWSETKNIVWKAAVPGRGHGSPIVVGSRVFLESADEQKQTQFVLCYDRATGKQLWQKQLHAGGFDGRFHKKNTRASSTLACDGERVFAPFYNAGALWLTALDLEGKQLWQKKLGNFVSHWGYSASPCLYQSLVIVAGDHKGEGGGYLVALDRQSGAEKW
ncbi:MAG: PQQ-binding-like beta-propeller repeat protein, partial [Gemmataceae bacterium]